jgi:hypothetical protein
MAPYRLSEVISQLLAIGEQAQHLSPGSWQQRWA